MNEECFSPITLKALEDNRRLSKKLGETIAKFKCNQTEPKMSLLNEQVIKVGGSFQHTGTVVAEFKTTASEPRIVLEFDEPVKGMLHVYRPDQVEIYEGDYQ